MLYIDNLNATSFRMYGDLDSDKKNTFQKDYEARSVVVPYEDEPRVTIMHKQLGDRLVALKKFDEITIDGNTFLSAQAAVLAFNSMITSTVVATTTTTTAA